MKSILAGTLSLLALAAPASRAQSSAPVPGATAAPSAVPPDEHAAADGELNAVYKQLMARYGASDKALLQTAQRAWLKFRDAECAYETAGTAGGSVHSQVVLDCETSLTRERIKRLVLQRDCKEGDLSCNLPG